jgi:hypothetical protein
LLFLTFIFLFAKPNLTSVAILSLLKDIGSYPIRKLGLLLPLNNFLNGKHMLHSLIFPCHFHYITPKDHKARLLGTEMAHQIIALS